MSSFLQPLSPDDSVSVRARGARSPSSERRRVSAYRRGRFEGATALPVLLIDGIVAGMWERRKRGSGVELRVESFGQLTDQQYGQIEEEAARIGAFLGVEVELSVGVLG